MKIAVMQPYFFPYIGYYQLISAVDYFVVADNYQFSEGWINRNRILTSGNIQYLTVNLEKDSHKVEINKRKISNEFSREKAINKIHHSYRRSVFYNEFIGELISNINFQEKNLLKYLMNSIRNISNLLEIKANFINASELEIQPSMSPEDKIISICKKLNGNCYINLPGGKNLYSPSRFRGEGVDLEFIKPNLIKYDQKNEKTYAQCNFIENLSIIDLIFNVGIDNARKLHLPSFEVLK